MRQSEQRETASKSPEKVNQSTSNIPVTIAKTNGMTQLITSSPTNPQPLVNDRLKTNAIRQYMESQNKPVEFYGQVIDQDENPLSGVRVTVEVRHTNVMVPAPWGDEDQIIPIEKETDASGHFEINGVTGDGFNIESIQKDGYEVEPGLRTYHAVGGSLEQPIVFRMWKTNIHEQLITGEKKFQIVPDEKSYVIDLTRGTIAQSGEGNLKVWVKYPPQVNRGQLYDWSCEIDVINGGLLEENNLSSAMYSAPIEGYTSTFQFQQQIKGGQYGSSGSRRFYVMLKNGQEYGRITIELFAPYTDEISGMIRIQYAINPTGSRILKP
jgi:hypothetical protein